MIFKKTEEKFNDESEENRRLVMAGFNEEWDSNSEWAKAMEISRAGEEE